MKVPVSVNQVAPKKGNKTLRSALAEAARTASKTKNTYLSTRYRRIVARRGKSRAAVAVGHTILVIIYHILKKTSTLH